MEVCSSWPIGHGLPSLEQNERHTPLHTLRNTGISEFENIQNEQRDFDCAPTHAGSVPCPWSLCLCTTSDRQTRHTTDRTQDMTHTTQPRMFDNQPNTKRTPRAQRGSPDTTHSFRTSRAQTLIFHAARIRTVRTNLSRDSLSSTLSLSLSLSLRSLSLHRILSARRNEPSTRS
jgi:hypothetical protein